MFRSTGRGLLAAATIAATLLALTACGSPSSGDVDAASTPTSTPPSTPAAGPSTAVEAVSVSTPEAVAQEFAERAYSLPVLSAPDMETATAIIGEYLTPGFRDVLITVSDGDDEAAREEAWRLVPFHWEGAAGQTGTPSSASTSNLTTVVIEPDPEGQVRVEVEFDFAWSYEGREPLAAKAWYRLSLVPGADPTGPAWQVNYAQAAQARVGFNRAEG